MIFKVAVGLGRMFQGLSKQTVKRKYFFAIGMGFPDNRRAGR